MPNTQPWSVRGMTVLSAGRHCSADQLEQAKELLESVGRVAVVPESQQDAVTALSGSGPAYVFFVVEAMIDAAIALGLEPDTAHELAVQTALRRRKPCFGKLATTRSSCGRTSPHQAGPRLLRSSG